MAVPIYVVCKSKGKTITSIGCEVPKREGRQVLEGNICCQYERLGGVFHYHFKIAAETVYMGDEKLHFPNRYVEVQVNVRSHEGRKTTKLEYIFKENLQEKNTVKFSLEELKKLNYGIKVFDYEQKENVKSKIALDYIRSSLFDINEFKLVPTTSDLNEELHEYITQAKEQNADMYIFGDLYPFKAAGDPKREEMVELLKKNGPKGIHDIHMNQGNWSRKDWKEHSGVYQDGGVLIHFNSIDEEKWVGIFLKFQSQCTKTHDETGYCNESFKVEN